MKRTLLISLALVAIALFSSNSSIFPFGVYSYLGNKGLSSVNRDAFISWMDSLSYNTNIMELFPEGYQPDGIVHSESAFSDMLVQMDKSGIDGIVTDRCWNSNNKHSAAYLTKSNYIRLEAEVKDETDVTGCSSTDDRFWYGSCYVKNDESSNSLLPDNRQPHRVGHPASDLQSAMAWACIPGVDSIGYAYTDIQSRWAVNPGNYPLIRELINIQPPVCNMTEDDCLYIIYKVKLSNITIPVNDAPLLYFRIAGYKKPGILAESVISLSSELYYDGGTQLQEGVFRYSDFLALTSQTDYFFVTAKVTYQQLIDSGLMENYLISSINPRLFWYGNCELLIDYIEIEDSLHRKLRLSDTNFQESIRNRISHISGLGSNVSGIYTYDEPTQSHFDSFRLIEQFASNSSLLTMTAVSSRGNSYIKPNGERYNHYAAFKSVAQPQDIMPDPYPITGLVGWSSSTVDASHFQTNVDSLAVKVYDSVRRISDDNRFMPVVQAFGKWDGTQWSDSFIRPPKATQKMLMYLPLCFGADGIFNYRLFGYHANSSGAGDYCAMYCNQDPSSPLLYDPPVIDRQTSDALLECNPRVLKYGELLNEDEDSWDLSATLLPNGLVAVNPDHPPILSQHRLSDILLAEEQSLNYKGYVQTGFYSTNSGSPYIMLVNRRSNYFAPPPGSTISSANQVPPGINFPSYFPEFPSQHVRLTPSASAPSLFGTQDVAFIDPYDYQIYKREGMAFIDVEIGPGDGKLLQMAGTPALVEYADVTANTLLAIKGGLCVNNGSTFTISPGTKTYVDENTVIRVMDNATLVLEGDVRIGRNAQIKVENGGSLIFNNAKVTYLPGAKILCN
ncbi:MAG TPA: hypothetical protein PKI15_06430, partial [Candidatus Cloacimonadota bacterium]|nr:hypothetical protein [Candidatus Cloacimonadota bacterium]